MQTRLVTYTNGRRNTEINYEPEVIIRSEIKK